MNSEAPSRTARPLRVFMIEDEPRMLDLVRGAIEAAPDLRLVGVASNNRQIAERLVPADCDVLLLDFELPDTNALEVLRRLRGVAGRSQLRVLIFTAFEHEERLLFAIEAGADGYLLKETPLDLLLAEIRSVHLGGSPITPRLARAMLTRLARPAAELSPLTEAEDRVLKLFALGLTYNETARKLGVSIHTVKNHVEHIYRKLETRSRSGAIERARELGIVS